MALSFKQFGVLFFFLFFGLSFLPVYADKDRSPPAKKDCGDMLSQLSPLPRGDLTAAAAEADRRVHLFIMQNRRLPQGSSPDEFSELKINKNRWLGNGKFSNELKHQRLHQGPVEAWTRQIEMLKPIRTSSKFTSEGKQRLIKMLDEEIFAYLPPEEQTEKADEIVVKAWIAEGKYFERSAEWKRIFFSHARWIGSGQFRKKVGESDKSSSALHGSRLEALQAAEKLLLKYQKRGTKDVSAILREVQKTIFSESDLKSKREITIEKIVDFIIKNSRLPKTNDDLNECDYNEMGIIYELLTPKGSDEKDSKPFENFAHLFEEVHRHLKQDPRYLAMSVDQQNHLSSLVETKIKKSKKWYLAKLPVIEQRSLADQSVADWIYKNKRMPVMRELRALENFPVDESKWFGKAKYRFKYGELRQHALHRHASRAWSAVYKRLESVPVDEHMTVGEKEALLHRIQLKIEISRMNKAEKREWLDLKIAEYILKNSKIPEIEIRDESPSSFRHLFGVSFKKWSGTETYSTILKSQEPHPHAIHPDPAEAWLSVREVLKTLPLLEGMTEEDRVQRIEIVNQKIKATCARFGIEWNPED